MKYEFMEAVFKSCADGTQMREGGESFCCCAISLQSATVFTDCTFGR